MIALAAVLEHRRRPNGIKPNKNLATRATSAQKVLATTSAV
jgi:hypothetical protein